MKKSPKLVIEPRLRVNFGPRFAFGPGKAGLLEQIHKTGSIAEAAKAMGMSYMRAWMLVKSLNRAGSVPLVETARGGRRRGGASLTPPGRLLLKLYRELESRSAASTRTVRQKLLTLLGAL